MDKELCLEYIHTEPRLKAEAQKPHNESRIARHLFSLQTAVFRLAFSMLLQGCNAPYAVLCYAIPCDIDRTNSRVLNSPGHKSHPWHSYLLLLNYAAAKQPGNRRLHGSRQAMSLCAGRIFLANISCESCRIW